MSYYYESAVETEISPARSAAAVTPNDSADLANSAKALWVGVEGDVVVDTTGGQTSVIFKNVKGILPVSVKRVRSTNTTATDIVALY